MPQTSPMFWVWMFLYFLACNLLMAVFLYYSFLYLNDWETLSEIGLPKHMEECDLPLFLFYGW